MIYLHNIRNIIMYIYAKLNKNENNHINRALNLEARRGHSTVKHIGNQSFQATFSNSLAQKLWVNLLTFI